MDELAYWIAFAGIVDLGPSHFERLERFFGSLDLAWRATAAELAAAGISEKVVADICEARPNIDPAAEVDRLDNCGAWVMTWNDPRYSERLREITLPPPVLFCQGTIDPQDDLAIGMVGTRDASAYGKQAATEVAFQLARNQVTVVSGFALGIDTFSHTAALAAGGRTIAVLGAGLDINYPASNRDLRERILDGRGAIVSEFPLGTKPYQGNFPQRNRIISGLSRGVVIVEADVKSGSLITAGYALDQGRDVFAVPGSIHSKVSRGTNTLIKSGAAKLISSAQDVLDELNIGTNMQGALDLGTPKPVAGNKTEAAVLQALSGGPAHIDEICAATGYAAATVGAALAMLELQGTVRHLGAMHYALAR